MATTRAGPGSILPGSAAETERAVGAAGGCSKSVLLELGELAAGQHFGELALIDPEAKGLHTASVIAHQVTMRTSSPSLSQHMTARARHTGHQVNVK